MRSLRVSTTVRYILLLITVLIGLHILLIFSHDGYGRAASSSLSDVASKLPWTSSNLNDIEITQEDVHKPAQDSATAEPASRMNATIFMLARNSDKGDAVKSILELEAKFNRKYKYPWTFLNDEPFTDDFKQAVSEVISGSVSFGQIPREHWVQPEWVDEERARAGRETMVDKGVVYGDSVSYRNMCRFNSGFFYRHPLLRQYKWYWRVEPDVRFHCDINMDPFRFMEENDKVYAFTIALFEFHASIPSLWDTVKGFMNEYPEYISTNNAVNFVSADGGESYNFCHFWSNFEIANMDFWRSEAYTKFFEYLDATGGFYYERWGDAPIHSIAVSLLARKDQIHFFDEIGYEHHTLTHCPKGLGMFESGQCTCRMAFSFDYDRYSCLRQWERIGR